MTNEKNMTITHARLGRSRAALVVYDADAPRRARMLNAALTMAEMYRWQVVEAKALHAVRSAFWLDTRDRNSRDRAYGVDIATLRAWIEHFDREDAGI